MRTPACEAVMPRIRSIALTLTMGAAGVSAAFAQPVRPPVAPPAKVPVWRASLGTKFFPIDIDEALVKAAAESKLVVVFVYNSHDRTTADELAFMRETTWRNPTLASYLAWRAVAIEVDAAFNPWVYERWRLDANGRDMPGVVVLQPFPPGERLLEKIMRLWNPLSEEIGVKRTPKSVLDAIPDIVPSATNVLFQVDFTHERLATRDPGWKIESDLANPMPQPPPREDPLYQVEDQTAVAIADPPPDDRGWRAAGRADAGTASPTIAAPLAARPAPALNHAPYDVIERLDQARAALESRDSRLAAGLYTWVWERSEDLDPASRAFRRCILPDELREFAEANDLVRERFAAVRDQASRRLLWASFSDLMVWFTLNEICDDDAENIRYLDLYINDRDEAAMMPRAHAAAYRIMAARERFIDPWHIDAPARRAGASGMPTNPDEAALAHVRAVAKRLNEPRQATVSVEDFEKLRAFRRDYLIDEAARLHTALLRAGRDGVAHDAVDRALGALTDPGDRAQLLKSAVFCALATGQGREAHARYLADAAALGFPNITLDLRLRETLADPGGGQP